MQYDNGKQIKQYFPIPNDVWKKVNNSDLSDLERAALAEIIEKTVGYSQASKWQNTKKGAAIRNTKCRISQRKMAEWIGCSPRHAARIMDSLEEKNIIRSEMVEDYRNGHGKNHTIREITLNTNTNTWGLCTKRLTKPQYERLKNRAVNKVVKKMKAIDKANNRDGKPTKASRYQRFDVTWMRKRFSVIPFPSWCMGKEEAPNKISEGSFKNPEVDYYVLVAGDLSKAILVERKDVKVDGTFEKSVPWNL